MNASVLQQILKRHQEIFINNIARELEESHDKWFEEFGFPIFGVTSKDYHEQVYFQSYLESYTRKMINGILKDMLDDVCADFTWPELDCHEIYNGYTNSECEEKFGFEFVDNVDRIGYRYSFFHEDEINSLRAKWNIDKIKLVLWQTEDHYPGFEYANTSASVIALQELFEELFFDTDKDEVLENYKTIVGCVQDSVSKANEMISLVTLPGFTPSYIHRTRKEILCTLKKEIEDLSVFSVKNENFKSTEDNSRLLIEKYNLSQLFLNDELEQAFVGAAPYGKSYMTSEYLYRYFKDNPLFDYTPIVSGYIKSIEQVLNAICVSFRNSQQIQINMGSFTLGSYTEFLNNNEMILREELRPAKGAIIDCLNSYRVESRNHLFHKDYFNDWERVDTIRKNTIFLYAVLLGAADSKLLHRDWRTLGVLNMEYDRLFEILDKKDPSTTYSFVYRGVEHSNMRKEMRYEGIQYDKNGLIKSSMTFRNSNYDSESVTEFSPRNMPQEIWETNLNGEKLRKLWSYTNRNGR